LTVTVVFPTPPLPLATAMIRSTPVSLRVIGDLSVVEY
jgi:hypothetical protein